MGLPSPETGELLFLAIFSMTTHKYWLGNYLGQLKSISSNLDFSWWPILICYIIHKSYSWNHWIWVFRILVSFSEDTEWHHMIIIITMKTFHNQNLYTKLHSTTIVCYMKTKAHYACRPLLQIFCYKISESHGQKTGSSCHRSHPL